MYFKILRNDLNNRGFQYCEGLNVDTKPFDSTQYCGGGLFFTDEKHIMAFADYGDKIAVVEVPEGERVVRVGSKKYKAHSVILKEIRDLWTVETLEWLKGLNVDFHSDKDYVFRYACERGYLEAAKWMYNLCRINIYANNERAFRFTCLNGNLEVAKWLYSLGDIDIHINDEFAFRWACANDHLEVAKWLCSLGDIDIHTDNEWAFRFACKYGHLEVAKWLCSLGDIDIHAEEEYAFRYACENGHLEVAKWLYSLGNIDIHAINNWVFKNVKNLEILEFLQEISK